MVFRPLRQLLWQVCSLISVLLGLFAVWQYQSIQLQQKQQQLNQVANKTVHQLSEQSHVLGYLAQLKSSSSFDVVIKTPTTKYLPLDITNQLEQLAQLQQRINTQLGKNKQLQQQANTIIAQQLQLTDDLLTQYRQQQRLLKQQLQQEQVVDALLKSRQRAFITLTEQIEWLSELKQALTKALFQLSLLQPQLRLNKFEISKQAIVQLMRVWSKVEPLLFAESSAKLSVGFHHFKQLLVEPHLLLATWQGMLRLNQAYQQQITQLSNQVSALNFATEPLTNTKPPSYDQQLFIMLLVGFLAILVWRVTALFGVLALLSDKLSPKWQQQATELTAQVAELNQQIQGIERLNQRQQCYFWCSSSNILLVWLKQQNLVDAKLNTWRQLLAFEQLRQVLQLLRTAKKQQQVQLMRLQDKQQRQWQLAVYYDQQWYINLLNVTDYQLDNYQLKQQIEKLRAQCNDQLRAQILQTQAQLAQINSQIQQWQHQVLSNTVSVRNWQKVTRFLYRQQNDCWRTIQALQLLASTQISSNELAFNTWLKQLHWQQQLLLQPKQLHWLVDVDMQLQRQVEFKQNAFMVWYQQLLTILLSRVSQAELVVQFKLVDQQHQRGMVQLTIAVKTRHHVRIENLLQYDTEHSDDDHQIRLLKQLSSQLFIEKFVLDQTPQLTLSCQFPVILQSMVGDDIIKQRKLAQHHWVIIASKSSRQQALASLIAGCKAKVSSFATAEQFLAKHMVVEHLIYLAPEPISTDLQSYLTRHPQCKLSTVSQGAAIERVTAWWPESLIFTSDLFSTSQAQKLHAWPDIQQKKVAANILVYVKQSAHANYLLAWLNKLGANINLALSKNQFEQYWQSGGYNLAFIDDHTASITSESYSQQTIFALSDGCYQQLKLQPVQSHQRIAIWSGDIEQWPIALAPWLLANDPLVENDKIAQLAQGWRKLSVIDFVKFAQHQGCIEVAAIMLTEYIEQLEHHVQLLQQAIINQQNRTIEQQLNQSLKLSKFIAAEQLNQLLQALQSASAQQLVNYLPQLQQQLIDVKQQAQLL